jgi:hypothetical protein
MPKTGPLDVFEDNIADAERLLLLTRMLVNTRTYRMRRELRDRVGSAMGLPKRKWEDLDCVESNDLFLVLMPDGEASRDIFTAPELRPLLRQSIVAVCAAVESYVAEKACTYIPGAINDPPGALNRLPVSFRDVLMVGEYERHGWAYRKLLKTQIDQMASAKPNRIGEVFEVVGKKNRNLWKNVDARRKAETGDSCRQLEELVERRNRIAHTGDRTGRGKAQLRVKEVDRHVRNAREIVEALDAVL